MAVTNKHPDYIKRSPQWTVVRDCVEGEDEIKAKGVAYLPKLSGSTEEVYEAYKKRARWNNYTARNLEGLHGLIFRRTPVVNCPKKFKKSKILDNIDRKGTSFSQFVSDSVYDSMQTSFGGIMLDMPAVDLSEQITEAQGEVLGLRPYLRYYPAESIINWGYDVINGVEQLSYVVLEEYVDGDSDDEFSHVPKVQYRVLDVRSGVYVQRLFTQVESKKENGKEDKFTEVVIPVSVKGEYLTEIPFVMIPGDKPEKPMFYDLAMCNIGHYQKSADYENGVHLTTIPTGYVTGHEQQTYEDGNKEIIRLGWDSFLMFPEPEAKVGNLSFSGVGLVHCETAMAQSLSDMAILGSRLLVTEKGTSESADSAKIHRAGENARLATFAKNISAKLTRILEIMAKWMGISGKMEVQLCTDYDTLAFDPNALNALANLAEAGKLPQPYVFYNLKNGEYTPRDSNYEEYAALLELEQSGATPLEIVEAYRQIQEGKELHISKTDNPDNENEDDNLKNDEAEDDEDK